MVQWLSRTNIQKGELIWLAHNPFFYLHIRKYAKIYNIWLQNKILVAHVPSIYPSTSTEAYDRRQALKNIYTKKKSSVPSVANNDDRLTVKPSSSTLLPLRLLERRPPRGTFHFILMFIFEKDTIFNNMSFIYTTATACFIFTTAKWILSKLRRVIPKNQAS